MAAYMNDDLEDLEDDYFDFDGFDVSGTGSGDPSSADNHKNDTSAVEYRNGKDMQGIPWERLNYNRDQYRKLRLKQYRNYENLSLSHEGLDRECKQVESKGMFYDFCFNTRLVKSTIVHFQKEKEESLHYRRIYKIITGECPKLLCYNYYSLLRYMFLLFFVESCDIWEVLIAFHFTRVCKQVEEHPQRLAPLEQHLWNMLRNLVWATSKHDVYMTHNYSVMHWSSLLQRGKEVLNVAGQVVPKQNVPGAGTLSRVHISTMALKDSLMVAGGFRGELIFKYVDKPGVAFCTNVTDNKISITNAVDVYESSSGATRVMAANNDFAVRTFDAERYSLLGRFAFPWSVNNTSVSPDGKLLAVLGDSSDCLIADTQSGKEIATLKGHLDYSFSSAWHPDGHVLATGNQDTTCRLWDTRNLSAGSFAVLKGRIGAVRGLKFSSDGRFLAMSEAADFVHVYDACAGYERAQEIDLFGEIAGVAFSPDTAALFVGVADRTHGSLLEFSRRQRCYYLDSYV